MKTVKVSEAKTHLSQLLDSVEAGEEVIITRARRPIAKLIPYHVDQWERKPGCWKGKVKISKDFNELPEDLSQVFRGEAG